MKFFAPLESNIGRLRCRWGLCSWKCKFWRWEVDLWFHARPMVFSNDHVFFLQITARTPIKNHSKGIHEKEWHSCDLRKELCDNGGIGSRILRKTNLFFCVYSENIKITLQIWFWAVSAHMRSSNEPGKVLDRHGLLLGASSEEYLRSVTW